MIPNCADHKCVKQHKKNSSRPKQVVEGAVKFFNYDAKFAPYIMQFFPYITKRFFSTPLQTIGTIKVPKGLERGCTKYKSLVGYMILGLKIIFTIHFTIIFFNYAVTTPFEGAILEGFNEQHQYQNSKKKAPYLMTNQHFLVQIRCRFNANFSWAMLKISLIPKTILTIKSVLDYNKTIANLIILQTSFYLKELLVLFDVSCWTTALSPLRFNWIISIPFSSLVLWLGVGSFLPEFLSLPIFTIIFLSGGQLLLQEIIIISLY